MRMPCATIHLIVADRLLDRWSNSPDDRPFDPDATDQRGAFLHGSLAPDMGFVPGVDRLVSELAHYVRPARLARTLIEEASDDVERAFAWGWVAHVVTDVEIHPIVGRAVGERLFGNRDRRVDAAEDCATHVAVEVGLDIAFLGRHPETSPPPAQAHLGPSNIGQLVRALERTYGGAWREDVLAGAHERAVARTKPWPRVLRALSAGRPGPWPGRGSRRSVVLGAGLAMAASLAPRGGAVRGFLSACPPGPWMVDEVDAAVRSAADQVAEVARRGVDTLPDRNLETGGPSGAGLGHPASDDAAVRLEARRAARTAGP